MMQVETSVVIQRPIDAIFAYMSDARNSGNWQIGLYPNTLETVTRTKTRTRRRRARPAVMRPARNPTEFTLLQPNRRLGFRSCSGPFEFDVTYHLDRGGDATTITCTCRVRAGRAYLHVEPLVGQFLALQSQVNLAILRTLVEGKCEVESDQPAES